MNIINKWDKLMAIGCTHGEYANQGAINAVLKFSQEFRPKHRIHLGDAWDTRALRTGARGSSDESAPLEGDLQAGRDFIRAYRPTVFTEGNHDARPRLLMEHHNTIVSECAKYVYQRMMEPIKQCKALWIPWDVWSHYEIGGYRFFHGVNYGRNYLRDTAMSFGNSVVAHAHRAGIAKGERLDCPTAYGVGTLADIHAMGYAATRTSTMAWSHGMVWGYVKGDKAHLNLHEWKRGETEWMLPI